jgi:hypothetical protein
MGSHNNPRQITNGKLRCGSKRHSGNRMVPVGWFSKKAPSPDGLDYSCKKCRTIYNRDTNNVTYRRWKEKDPIRAMLQGVKGSAKRRNLSCTITTKHLAVPALCPILGIPLVFTRKRSDNTPSVDRIDNSKGYTPKNIVVCSWRANMLKKDATIKELEMISKFYKRKIK